MPTIAPDEALENLPWLTRRAKVRKAVGAAGFERARDLLTHYPRRYEDRRRFQGFPNDVSPQPLALFGRVTNTSLKRFGRRGSFEATFEEIDAGVLSMPIILRWFNLPFIHKLIAVDQRLVVFGKTKVSGRRLVIDHPEYEVVEEGDDGMGSLHMGRIVPVYPLKEGLRQNSLRELLFELTENLDWSAVPDLLREPSDDGAFAGMNRSTALQTIHFPSSMDAFEQARRYLALEEFFGMQLAVVHRKRRYARQAGASHCGDGHLLDRFLAAMPFEPTRAQRRAISELRQGLSATVPMNRLLQGDVGSGKTLVAAAGLVLAVEAGFQAAMMAPTQILAEQHFLNLRRWIEPLGIRVGLRTGSRKEDGLGALPLFDGGGGSTDERPQILVGTHALLFDGDVFANLGFVVIDEQHKFGVAQRAKLAGHGTLPDVLVMTATPIPRTLTMTVYGDLDVSVLDELPPGRTPTVTAVRAADKKTVAGGVSFVRDHLAAGRQAYVVYPLVEESETLTAKAATVEFAAWQERVAPSVCGLIHGRLPPAAKEAVMERFRDGEIRALVATSVIEVGVDVPNASIMLVFNAERFGLAQLHQLRGRVGRGAHKSYCILFHDPKNSEAAEKLAVLAETSDGFRVAEADLQIRGPGDVLGTAQSGLPALRLGDLLADTALVRLARSLAAEVLDADPDLELECHHMLRGLIVPPGDLALA